ncbi:AAA family ATPase [Pseudofrankia sp. EUN1h]|nr:AAA family ATPase [Pseudofrankia sp. EUN1h]
MPRLSPGELRRQVAAFLVSHPGAHTPGDIARALAGRSSGAVGNALDTLAAHGAARLTSAKPRKFSATGLTGAAAYSAPPKPTAPPRPRTPKAIPPTPPDTPPAPAPRPAAASDPALPPGAVRRPGGGIYRPRQLAGLPDVEALRKLRAAGVPVLLYGPPGTGKTSLVEAAHPDLITIAGDGDTTVGDFLGEYTQAPGGGYEFVYGPLVRAMIEGRCLFIDDATLISPAVLACVYPAMDGRGEIQVKTHKGETITAAPGFYLCGGHNPGVHGAVLTEALSSRFAVQIKVTSDYDLARALRISPRAVNVARDLARRREAGGIGWAPQLRELIAFQKVAAALGEDVAAANLIGQAPDEDRDVVADVVKTVYRKSINPLALGRQL